jgi:hypothetical protein
LKARGSHCTWPPAHPMLLPVQTCAPCTAAQRLSEKCRIPRTSTGRRNVPGDVFVRSSVAFGSGAQVAGGQRRRHHRPLSFPPTVLLNPASPLAKLCFHFNARLLLLFPSTKKRVRCAVRTTSRRAHGRPSASAFPTTTMAHCCEKSPSEFEERRSWQVGLFV